MSFSAPYFLIGFLALSVPIIIHLWSKNTKKSIAFGSVRFLKETETRTMRSIMPSQWLLLFSRLFLLSLLVLLLAGLQLEKPVSEYKNLYLVDTRYSDTDLLNKLLDTIPETSMALWLSEGFPPVDVLEPPHPENYWELLANPPQISAIKATVISPLLAKDFPGNRKKFPMEYDWITPPITPYTTQLISYRKGDQSFTINTSFDEWTTSHELAGAQDEPAIRILYYLEATSEYDQYQEMFEAALRTLQSLSPLELLKVENAIDADWILWLSPESAPRDHHIIAIDKMMVTKWNEYVPGVVSISNSWSKEDAINLNLPEKFLNLFSNDLAEDSQWDLRTLDPTLFSYDIRLDNSIVNSQESATGVLWILLVFALITERWLSFKYSVK
ncbi:MAG: BatA domain-containing protein [Cyclobacteriaceae bacterium]